MTDPLLELTDVHKVFHVRRSDGFGREALAAVAGVTFSVGVGASVAIVGESGSGKSTCARMIVGLERPTAGTIRVLGEDWTGRRRLAARERRRRGGIVQIVFQDPYQSLDRRQQVRDCVEEALALHGFGDRPGRRRRADELLDQVGLDGRQGRAMPRDLSGGQRQRVAVARALAAQPRLLILDEAVAALDVSIQAQVLNLLSDVRDTTGIAYLLISHDLSVVRQMCDEVVVMKDGHVVESGATTDVLRRPAHPYTRRLVDSVPRAGWRPRRRGTEFVTDRLPEGSDRP